MLYCTGHSDGKQYRPKDINLAIKSDIDCARDNKWALIEDVIDRKECDCVTFFKVTIALYRFWKCRSSGVLQDLGFGSVLLSNEYGGRDYWFDRYPRSKQQCVFPSANMTTANLTHGAVFTSVLKPSLHAEDGALDLSRGECSTYVLSSPCGCELSSFLFRLGSAVLVDGSQELQQLRRPQERYPCRVRGRVP